MAGTVNYPVRVEAALDVRLSRWLWLVKWLLVIPHLIVLALLWVGFVVLSVVAFFSILFTGRYPRTVFDINVGILRWSWRVAYYTYGVNGTDRYPPFTLADVADYPAHFEIAYPGQLSRGLVLVKWWLLALPHYLIVGLFLGGGSWLASQGDGIWTAGGGGGLVGLLVLIAAVVLLFTGTYPQAIYDFVLGMNRWALRVAAYAALMTDDYPPFRLDMGGADPNAGGTLTLSRPDAAGVPPGMERSPTPPGSGVSAGRVVTLVAGSVLVLTSLPLLAGGGTVLWADRTHRDDTGFLTTSPTTFTTAAYALTTDGADLDLDGDVPAWLVGDSVVGDVRIRVTSTDPEREVFVGIAPAADVDRYLGASAYSQVDDFEDGTTSTMTGGSARPAPPQSQPIWAAQSSGTGTRSVLWSVRRGTWSVVVMGADASAGLTVEADAAVEAPALRLVAALLIGGGAVLLLGGAAIILLAARRPRPRT